jgi:hypothetical protein
VHATLEKYVTYQKNNKLLAFSLFVSALTYLVYAAFFDILVPFIPRGSVRYNSGVYFAIPIFFLICGQTLFLIFLLHLSMRTIAPDQRDALRAYFVASMHVLLFSILYAFFPYYGPYTLIVYFMPNENFTSYSYPLLVLWIVLIILATYLLVKRAFHLESATANIGPRRMLLLAATMLAITMAIAS